MSAPFARSAAILRGIIGRYLHLLYVAEPHAVHYRTAQLNHAWRARTPRHLQSRNVRNGKCRHKESSFLPRPRLRETPRKYNVFERSYARAKKKYIINIWKIA